jgi:tRNA(Ile)-lysidine synthase
MPAAEFARLPSEIALRLLGRSIARCGDEGPAELGKLESLLAAALPAAQKPQKTPFRRTLAGALLTISGGQMLVEKAPARRLRQNGRVLTKARDGRAGPAKTR